MTAVEEYDALGPALGGAARAKKIERNEDGINRASERLFRLNIPREDKLWSREDADTTLRKLQGVSTIYIDVDTLLLDEGNNLSGNALKYVKLLKKNNDVEVIFFGECFEAAFESTFVQKDALLQQLGQQDASTQGKTLVISSDAELTFKHQSLEADSMLGVVGQEVSAKVLQGADFFVQGQGAGWKLLQEVAVAHGISDGPEVIATNSPPVTEKLDARPGLPRAFTNLIQAIAEGRLFCIDGNGLAGKLEGVTDPLLKKLELIGISREEHEAQYNNIANQALWQLFHKPHIVYEVPEFDAETWELFYKVSQRMVESTIQFLEEKHKPASRNQPVIWVHDYQLAPYAQELQRKLGKAHNYALSFFLHIPFPPVEVLIESLGEEKAKEVVNWFCFYQSIGFHIEEYAENYKAACERFGLWPAEAFVQPISVDVQYIRNFIGDAANNVTDDGYSFVQEDLKRAFDVAEIQAHVGEKVTTCLAGVERNDITKAGLERVRAWALLAETNPEIFRKNRIIEVIAPNRNGIDLYKERYEDIKAIIAHTNTRLRHELNIEYDPIHHIEGIGNWDDVMAAFAMSDCFVLTPARDGFNMSALEWLVVALELEDNPALKEKFGKNKRMLMSNMIGLFASLTSNGVDEVPFTTMLDFREGVTPERIKDGLLGFLGQQSEVEDDEAKKARMAKLREYLEKCTIQAWHNVCIELSRHNAMKQRIGDMCELLEEASGA